MLARVKRKRLVTASRKIEVKGFEAIGVKAIQVLGFDRAVIIEYHSHPTDDPEKGGGWRLTPLRVSL